MPVKCNVWRSAGDNTSLNKIEVKEENGKTMVIADIYLNDVASNYQIVYTMSADGALAVNIF
jgi:beta-galactosidase